MGLDTVELVMEVEETFDISIDDRDAEEIVTLGDLHRYVVARLALKDRKIHPCPTAAVFYRLRRALMAVVPIDRRRIRPASRVEDFVPAGRRREVWEALGRQLHFVVPPLVFPPVMRGAIAAVVLAGALLAWSLLACIVLRGERFGTLAAPVWLLLINGPLVVWVGTCRLVRPCATALPAGCETLGGTVETLVRMNYGRLDLREATAGRDDQAVWEAVRAIVAEQTGVKAEELTKDMSFTDDLRMD